MGDESFLKSLMEMDDANTLKAMNYTLYRSELCGM